MVIKQNSANFRFYGSLNDFLGFNQRGIWFRYFFKGNPAVKDTLEAIGVPHVEIDCILINKQSAGFYHQIKQNDRVVVYPTAKKYLTAHVKYLKAKPLKHPTFILDAHLGKLARHLRLLGFNTLYKRDYSDEEIVEVAAGGRHIVLTRDIGLLKNKIIKRGYWIRATDPRKQIKEVIKEFDLGSKISPFTLCLECNGKITSVRKSQIIKRLPPMTKEYYRRFYICRRCKKIYWRGAHYAWLSGFIDKINKQIKKAR